MTEFKVGDRVKMVKHSADSMPITLGWLGIVVKVKPNGRRIGVSWDGFPGGHNCDVDMGKYGRPANSGRWMDPCCLELIEAAKSKFKVGDKVILVRHKSDSTRLPLQATGRICREVGNSESELVAVCWDGFERGHDCAGSLHGDEANSGWNVYIECLELVVDSEAAELVEMGEAIVDAITSGSKPKTKPEETASEFTRCCANCQEWFPVEGCEHGFCNSWHNFCTKNEFCSRIKMCG